MLRELLLFDVDGTLLLDDAYAAGHAMERAAEDVFGVLLEERAIALGERWGRTDRRIMGDILRAAGVDDARIEDGMEAWMQAAAEAFEQEADRAARWWRVREGTGRVLPALADAGHIVAVVSNNLEAIARSKIRRMGLESVVARGQGAFGSEHDVRAGLIPVARERAGRAGHTDGPWPREHTVVIGDTPDDIAAAKADGVRPVMFASERFARSKLKGATVITRLDELATLLL